MSVVLETVLIAAGSPYRKTKPTLSFSGVMSSTQYKCAKCPFQWPISPFDPLFGLFRLTNERMISESRAHSRTQYHPRHSAIRSKSDRNGQLWMAAKGDTVLRGRAR